MAHDCQYNNLNETPEISIRKGTSKVLHVTIVDAQGATYMLKEGDVVRFGVKKTPFDKNYSLLKEVTSADQNEDGVIVISIKPGDTSRMYGGDYLYDIGLQSGDDYHPVIDEACIFHVKDSITSYKEV